MHSNISMQDKRTYEVQNILKAPFQHWSGPEGSKKLRFPDFMKTAQDCG